MFCTSQTEKFTCNYVRAACSYVVPHRVKYTETYIARILDCVTVQYGWLEMHNAATTFMADLLKITVYVSTTLNMLITHIQQQQIRTYTTHIIHHISPKFSQGDNRVWSNKIRIYRISAIQKYCTHFTVNIQRLPQININLLKPTGHVIAQSV